MAYCSSENMSFAGFEMTVIIVVTAEMVETAERVSGICSCSANGSRLIAWLRPITDVRIEAVQQLTRRTPLT